MRNLGDCGTRAARNVICEWFNNMAAQDQLDPPRAQSEPLTAAAAGFRKKPNARRVASSVPGFVEIGIVVLIAIATVRLMYDLIAPLPTAETLPSRIGSATPMTAEPSNTENPFRAAAIEASAPADDGQNALYEETRLDLKLHGVLDLGGVQSATISTPDTKQGAFRVGETVWNNVTLERIISREQVVISQNGSRETLTLINRDPREAAARAAEKASSQRAAPQSQAQGGIPIGRIVTVLPIAGDGGMRLVVQPGVDQAAFRATGLRAGDVIIAVNGRRLGRDILAEARELANAGEQQLALTVERDGVTLLVTVDMDGGSAESGNND